MNIPVFRPLYDVRETKAVESVLQSRWVGLGPKTKEFEEKFADYVGAKYAIATNSATAALHIALHLLDIKAGDEVIVPTMTFVSTAHAVEYLRAKPIFCDVREDTLMIDLDDAYKRITPRTKAILPVAYGGQPVMDMEGNIPVVWDCAHAAGAKFPHPGMACWSFHAVKNLACGDGGMITTNDEGMYLRAKKLRWLGIDKGTWDRTKLDQSYWWEYNVEEIGYKYHMNDISAAIGLVQLDKLEQMNFRRREQMRRYMKHLSGYPLLFPIQENASHHLFGIRHPRRDELAAYLQENGVATGVHYKPIHLYKAYGNTPSLPVAERVWKEILTLPLFPDLTIDEIDYICDKIELFEGFTGGKAA